MAPLLLSRSLGPGKHPVFAEPDARTTGPTESAGPQKHGPGQAVVGNLADRTGCDVAPHAQTTKGRDRRPFKPSYYIKQHDYEAFSIQHLGIHNSPGNPRTAAFPQPNLGVYGCR